MSCPLFVELCAGTAAVSLRLAHPRARPPVSRMGAKTGYADVILRCMGLRPGQGADHYLWCEPDPGVRLLLHAYTDRELALAAADIIRGWQDEEPRALWERLRAEGPARCPPVDAREVARWRVLAGWAYRQGEPASGFAESRTDSGTGAGHGDSVEMIASKFRPPTVPGYVHDDARTVDPREVARYARILTANRLVNPDPVRWKNTGNGGYKHGGADFCTPIDRLAAGFESAVEVGPSSVVDDARTVATPPKLPSGTVVYADVPYENTTGYAQAFPRSEWLPVVRRWRDAGALVCVSEAEPIPDLMAEGWHAVEITGERQGQKRTFGGTREWLTMSQKPHWTPSVQIDLWGNPINLSTGRG